MPVAAGYPSDVTRLRYGSPPRVRRVDWPLVFADMLGIVSVPVLLIGIHVLGSARFHDLLTYTSTAPTLHGLFGHWAVHYSELHLLENAAGFLFVACLAYGLAWISDERRWFRLSMVTILLVVPALSAVVSSRGFAAVTPELAYQARGASAVVAAVVGLAYVLSLGVVRRTYDLRATLSVGGTTLIAVLTVLLVQVGSVPTRRTLALPGVAAAILVFDGGLRLWAGSPGPETALADIDVCALARAGVAALLVALVMAGTFLALFPADPFLGPSITNVFAHAAGFLLGALVAAWGRRYWSVHSWI